MKVKNDPLDLMFHDYENQWDIHDLESNHSERFIAKQNRKNKSNRKWHSASIAASILIVIGLFTVFNKKEATNKPLLASAETIKTDSIFTVMVRYELKKIQEKNSPLNEKIIKDALFQMQQFDADYEKIKLELNKNGENKQIIYALINNFKTRISFLESVLDQLNSTEKLNTTTHEKTM